MPTIRLEQAGEEGVHKAEKVQHADLGDEVEARKGHHGLDSDLSNDAQLDRLT